MVCIMKVDYEQGVSSYFAFSTIGKMYESAKNLKKHSHIKNIELFSLSIDLFEPNEFLPTNEQREVTKLKGV